MCSRLPELPGSQVGRPSPRRTMWSIERLGPRASVDIRTEGRRRGGSRQPGEGGMCVGSRDICDSHQVRVDVGWRCQRGGELRGGGVRLVPHFRAAVRRTPNGVGSSSWRRSRQAGAANCRLEPPEPTARRLSRSDPWSAVRLGATYGMEYGQARELPPPSRPTRSCPASHGARRAARVRHSRVHSKR